MFSHLPFLLFEGVDDQSVSPIVHLMDRTPQAFGATVRTRGPYRTESSSNTVVPPRNDKESFKMSSEFSSSGSEDMVPTLSGPDSPGFGRS